MEKLFILILFIHFLADFALQTVEQGANKKKSNKLLVYHTLTYSIIWFVVSYLYFSMFGVAFLFTIITFITHTIIDYYSSRLSNKFFDKKDYHNGFVVIGADQVLHYLQLFYTFKFCIAIVLIIN